MSTSALGKKLLNPSMVCSGLKYATHRSHFSLLQDYLYMLCTLVWEKLVRSASLNEIVDPPLTQCWHFVPYRVHGTVSEMQLYISVSSLEFGGYYVYHVILVRFTYTVSLGVL
jgi:hypothetical protein